MKKSTILFSSVIVIVMLLLSGCTTGSYSVKNGNENNTTTKMSMSHDSFNGHKQTKITVKKDNPIEVMVNFTTESGTISAYISNDKGDDTENYIYEGNDIQTSSFTVNLTEAGTYIIRVDGADHSGSYSFSWGK